MHRGCVWVLGKKTESCSPGADIQVGREMIDTVKK